MYVKDEVKEAHSAVSVSKACHVVRKGGVLGRGESAGDSWRQRDAPALFLAVCAAESYQSGLRLSCVHGQ